MFGSQIHPNLNKGRGKKSNANANRVYFRCSNKVKVYVLAGLLAILRFASDSSGWCELNRDGPVVGYTP